MLNDEAMPAILKTFSLLFLLLHEITLKFGIKAHTD